MSQYENLITTVLNSLGFTGRPLTLHLNQPDTLPAIEFCGIRDLPTEFTIEESWFTSRKIPVKYEPHFEFYLRGINAPEPILDELNIQYEEFEFSNGILYIVIPASKITTVGKQLFESLQSKITLKSAQELERRRAEDERLTNNLREVMYGRSDGGVK